MNIQSIITKLTQRENLTAAEMKFAMQNIMSGKCTDAQVAGFLIALAMKGESVIELTESVKVMRNFALAIDVNASDAIDTAGTGGDRANLFNVSTISAIVAAGAGAKVVKHGNRGITSQSGSADLLEAAGVNINLAPEQISQCIQACNIGFVYAPEYHKATKYVREIRQQLATRTIFNLLGPLTNPAHVKKQVIGVFSRKWLRPMAQVCKNLGSDHIMVIHSADGLDEISVASHTYICELKKGKISEYQIRPEQFGLHKSTLHALLVSSPQQSLSMMHAIFDNRAGAHRDIICLNAGAAIYVSGIEDSLDDGIRRADNVIATGEAKAKLQQLISLSHQLTQ